LFVFHDRAPRPQPRHQFILADHGAFCRCEQTEDIERSAAEFHRLAIVQEATPSKIEPEPADANLLGVIRKPASTGLYFPLKSFRQPCLAKTLSEPSRVICILEWNRRQIAYPRRRQYQQEVANGGVRLLFVAQKSAADRE
jgi:hypothetical protein